MTTLKFQKPQQGTATKNIQITKNDLSLFRSLYRFRVLNTHQLAILSDTKNGRYYRRRLLDLFNAGYIDRPPEQRYIFTNQPGAYPMVYALGKGGASELQKLGFNVAADFWVERNKKIKALSLEHSLHHAEFFAKLHQDCQRSGRVRIIWKDEILAGAKESQRKKRKQFAWPTEFRYRGVGERSIIEPDDVFGLEFADQPKRWARKYFFLEIDSGKMNIVRSTASQSSILRKYYAYADTHNNQTARELFGVSNFRVLFVTSTQARISNMIAAFQQHIAGSVPDTVFLFASRDRGQGSDLLQQVWRTAGDEKTNLETINARKQGKLVQK